MCYRDMTFCGYYVDCKDGKECTRALTPAVFVKAETWMKDAPICRFVEKPTCYKEINGTYKKKKNGK